MYPIDSLLSYFEANYKHLNALDKQSLTSYSLSKYNFENAKFILAYTSLPPNREIDALNLPTISVLISPLNFLSCPK